LSPGALDLAARRLACTARARPPCTTIRWV